VPRLGTYRGGRRSPGDKFWISIAAVDRPHDARHTGPRRERRGPDEPAERVVRKAMRSASSRAGGTLDGGRCSGSVALLGALGAAGRPQGIPPGPVALSGALRTTGRPRGFPPGRFAERRARREGLSSMAEVPGSPVGCGRPATRGPAVALSASEMRQSFLYGLSPPRCVASQRVRAPPPV